MGQGGAATLGAHATWSRLSLSGPLACFFISCWFSGKNINARKGLAQFEFRMSLKRQDTQNSPVL
jgi:hypothetical protein